MEFKLARTCACAGRENLRDEGGTVFIPNGAVVMEMGWGQREEGREGWEARVARARCQDGLECRGGQNGVIEGRRTR